MYLLGKTYQEIADEVGEPRGKVREHIRRSDYYKPKPHPSNHYQSEQLPESYTIKADGSQISERILRLTAQTRTDKRLLLEAHGFDPNQWELIDAVSNLWHGPTKTGSQPLYQSKVRVKPLAFDYQGILDDLAESIQPIRIKPIKAKRSGYLSLDINDTHFDGIQTHDWHETSRDNIINLTYKGYKEIVIALMGDIFQVDNMRNTTSHFTPVDGMDIRKAVQQARQYIEPIIQASIENADRVRIIMLRGNHSETMEFMFAQILKLTYPELEIDDDYAEYSKAVMLGTNFVGYTHGYKNVNDTPLNLSIRYGELWGKSTHREIHAGHKHRESTDKHCITRVLPTRAVGGNYEKEQNFAHVHKAFQCFEFSEHDIKTIHYV